jgi:hypothetical protein
MSTFTSLAEWQISVYEAALRQLLWYLGLDVSDAATYQQYPFGVVDSLFARFNEYLCSSEVHDAVSASLKRQTEIVLQHCLFARLGHTAHWTCIDAYVQVVGSPQCGPAQRLSSRARALHPRRARAQPEG